MKAVPVLLLLLATTFSGCLGGEARTEWAFEVTQLATLADQGRSGKGVVVAILDTGINREHAALEHLFDGDLENGEVTHFQDFLGTDQGPAKAFDRDGHGSHVAGVLAASGSTLGDKLVYGGVDLRGGAPGIRLMVARVCGEAACDGNAIVRAVDWAAANGAQVLSLSLGRQASSSVLPVQLQDAMESAINRAIDRGIVVVASAGNDGPGNTDVGSPASIPRVIAVGAIQEDGSVWASSSRGDDATNPCRTIPVVGSQGRCKPNQKPELVAPGVDILSSWTDDSYARASGTSQATPFVTAAVALMLEGHGRLTDADDVARVKKVLVDTAQPVADQAMPHDEGAGYGLVQALAAVNAYR
ncbi:MAG: serine protease AprX [Thermoplasmata archaeon]|jgi:serine protease AprX|nr:serine protease AprX [Thermoplasmata archaeon]